MDSNSLFIVLGWDRSADAFVEKLLCLGRHVVLVDFARPSGAPEDVRFVAGDPRSADSLTAAGVQRAAGILCCLPDSDAVLAEARRLNPGIKAAALAGPEAAR